MIKYIIIFLASISYGHGQVYENKETSLVKPDTLELLEIEFEKDYEYQYSHTRPRPSSCKRIKVFISQRELKNLNKQIRNYKSREIKVSDLPIEFYTFILNSYK